VIRALPDGALSATTPKLEPPVPKFLRIKSSVVSEEMLLNKISILFVVQELVDIWFGMPALTTGSRMDPMPMPEEEGSTGLAIRKRFPISSTNIITIITQPVFDICFMKFRHF
jgi:hypothetical protein